MRQTVKILLCGALVAGVLSSCGGDRKVYLRPSGMPAASRLTVLASRVSCGYLEEDGVLICERCQCDGYKTALLLKAEAERLAPALPVVYQHEYDADQRALEKKIWKQIRDNKPAVEGVAKLDKSGQGGVLLLSEVFCWQRVERGVPDARDGTTIRSGDKPGKAIKAKDEIGLDIALLDASNGEVLWRERRREHYDTQQRASRHTHIYDAADRMVTEMMAAFPLRTLPVEKPAEKGEKK